MRLCETLLELAGFCDGVSVGLASVYFGELNRLEGDGFIFINSLRIDRLTFGIFEFKVVAFTFEPVAAN